MRSRHLFAALAVPVLGAVSVVACVSSNDNPTGASSPFDSGAPLDANDPFVPPRDANSATTDASTPVDASQDSPASFDAGTAPPATGDLQWAHGFGTTASAGISQVITDAQGNHYLCGSSSGGAADFGDAGTAPGLFIVKLDANGVVQWLSKPGGDYGYGVAMDPQTGGLFAILGFKNAFTLNATLYTPEGLDFLLVKVDPATGQITNAKQFGGAASEQPMQLAAGGGHLLTTGWFYGGDADFAGHAVPLVGQQDAWVLDVDETSFGYVFSEGYGGVSTNGSSGWGVALDSQANAYVGGYVYGATNLGGGTVDAGSTTPDVFLVALGPTGTYRWSKVLGTSGNVRDIAVDAHDNVYVAGNVGNDGNLGGGAVNPGGFAASYDSAGAYRWGTSFGGTSTYVGGLGVDLWSEAAVAGYFQSSFTVGDAGFTANSEENGFLLKLDAAGNPLWVKQWKGGVDVQPNSVDIAPNGSIGVAGSFFGGQMILDPSTTLDGGASADVPFTLQTSP